jgi:hypothetical protein
MAPPAISPAAVRAAISAKTTMTVAAIIVFVLNLMGTVPPL